MIAEFSSTEQGGDKAAWIRDSFATVPRDFPRIRALVWFNVYYDSVDWRVESSAASLAAYKEAIAPIIFQSSWR
jgi:endoglucanase